MVVVNTAQVASRAMLRDVLNRCKALRRRCGKTDEEEMANMSTGDPFRDKAVAFGREVPKTRELIAARNAVVAQKGLSANGVTVEESHEINRAMRELKAELDAMKALAEQAERRVAKAHRQKKKASSIALLEQDAKARQATCKSCEEMLEGLYAADAARFETPRGGTRQTKIGAMFEREQLMSLRRHKPRRVSVDDGESASGAGSGARLETDPETAGRMSVIHENNRRIDNALDILINDVGRLKDLARLIGEEIDLSNEELTQTTTTVVHANQNLKQLNRRLKKLVTEKAQPMNVAFGVACFLLFVALLGYFVYEFNLIK